MRALTCTCKGLSTSYVVQRQRIASVVLLPATRSEPLGSLWGLSTLLNHKSLIRALTFGEPCHITRGALTKTVTSRAGLLPKLSHLRALTKKPAHLGALTKTKTAHLGGLSPSLHISGLSPKLQIRGSRYLLAHKLPKKALGVRAPHKNEEGASSFKKLCVGPFRYVNDIVCCKLQSKHHK